MTDRPDLIVFIHNEWLRRQTVVLSVRQDNGILDLNVSSFVSTRTAGSGDLVNLDTGVQYRTEPINGPAERWLLWIGPLQV